MDRLGEFYLSFLLYPVSSETVLYRCFEEYFSLKISQEKNLCNFIINLQVKGNAQFVQKVTFEPLISNKTITRIGNVTKAATFKVRFTKLIKAYSYFFCDRAF